MQEPYTQGEVFSPFSFAVVADPHVHESERLGLDELVTLRHELSERRDIEFILFLGDFCWESAIEDLKVQLDRFDKPVHLVYGNNDWRRVAEYEAVFGPRDQVLEFGRAGFVFFFNCRLDSNDHSGRCSEDQWRWLEESVERLSNASVKHLFLAAHIPPRCDSGYYSNFFMSETDTDRFRDLCRRFHVTAAFFGHLHQDIVSATDNTQIIVTPSLNWNFTVSIQGLEPTERVYEKTKGGYYRIVHVRENTIEHSLFPLRMP